MKKYTKGSEKSMEFESLSCKKGKNPKEKVFESLKSLLD